MDFFKEFGLYLFDVNRCILYVYIMLITILLIKFVKKKKYKLNSIQHNNRLNYSHGYIIFQLKFLGGIYDNFMIVDHSTLSQQTSKTLLNRTCNQL